MENVSVVLLLVLLTINNSILSSSGNKKNTDRVSITVTKDGTYDINFGATHWLHNGSTSLQHEGHLYTTLDNSLQLAHAESETGKDKLGTFKRANLIYKIQNHTGVIMETHIKEYDDIPVIVFTQTFPDGLTGCSVGHADDILSSFPSFIIEKPARPMGVLDYGGLFMGYVKNRVQAWGPTMPTLVSGLESGPLVLFDDQHNILLISPLNKFMSTNMIHNKEGVAWGIMGKVDSVPIGYTQEVVLYSTNQGVNKAMAGWGELMQAYHGKDSTYRDRDPTVKYLGYYTDKGTYYYHMTEPKHNYEDTLLNIVDYSRNINIPYKYIQYDDWWYVIKGPGYGATVRWEPISTVFPHGLKYLYDKIQLPVIAHNRYWSNTTTYAVQNGGDYKFVMSGPKALPDDPEFWHYLFYTSSQWGLVTYEQDFLNVQSEQIEQLKTDIGLGDRWLRQMNDAADQFGMTLQYCMSLPRHALYSLMANTVTQIRASEDNLVSKGQWHIGITSMFASSLGVTPFKDNFWTSVEQAGNPYNLNQTSPLLQAMVAILSTGPVAPGDGIGFTDRTLLNRIHTLNGLLLKPTVPATAIDAQIYQMAFGGNVGPVGQVWSTFSVVSDIYFGIIFCGELENNYTITPAELKYQVSNSSVTYNFRGSALGKQLKPFTDKGLFLANCSEVHPCLYYVSPTIKWSTHSSVLLGELTKLVPMSAQRVTDISVSESDLQITISGSKLEQVYFYIQTNGITTQYICIIRETTAVLSVSKHTCT